MGSLSSENFEVDTTGIAEEYLEEVKVFLGLLNRESDVKRFLSMMEVNDISIPEDVTVMLAGDEAVEYSRELSNKYGTPVQDCAAMFTAPEGRPTIVVDMTQVTDENSAYLIPHELVHYDQWMRGDLVFRGSVPLWKGKEFPQPISGSDEYYKSPWELEAYVSTMGKMPKDHRVIYIKRVGAYLTLKTLAQLAFRKMVSRLVLRYL